MRSAGSPPIAAPRGSFHSAPGRAAGPATCGGQPHPASAAPGPRTPGHAVASASNRGNAALTFSARCRWRPRPPAGTLLLLFAIGGTRAALRAARRACARCSAAFRSPRRTRPSPGQTRVAGSARRGTDRLRGPSRSADSEGAVSSDCRSSTPTATRSASARSSSAWAPPAKLTCGRSRSWVAGCRRRGPRRQRCADHVAASLDALGARAA